MTSTMIQTHQTEAKAACLLSDIIKPSALITERPDLFTKGQVSWFLRQRHFNGLEESGAVLKVGKKLFIHRQKFTDWFHSKNV